MQITCPLCKQTEFNRVEEGRFFKRAGYECLSCGSRLIQKGEGQKTLFQVTHIGEAYSNCIPLFQDWTASLTGLLDPDLPIYPDSELMRFSQGDISTDWYESDLPEDLPVPLIPDERVVFELQNIYSWEDRLQKEIYQKGYRPKVSPGGWGKIKLLVDPRFAHNTETLRRGTLVITTQRYIFWGEDRTVYVGYQPESTVLPFQDGVGITYPERLRMEYFKGFYHWPLVAALTRGLVGIRVK